MKPGNGRAEVRGGVVPEFGDARMALERGLDDAALDAAPAAVDQPHFHQTGGRGRVDVGLDDGGDLPRREGVEVQLRFDRNVHRVVVASGHPQLSDPSPQPFAA